MSDSVLLCGYSLGRFVPSRKAFVGRRHVAPDPRGQCHDASAEPSVYITIIPMDNLTDRRQTLASIGEHLSSVVGDTRGLESAHGIGIGPGVGEGHGRGVGIGRGLAPVSDEPGDVGRASNGDLVWIENLGEPRPTEIRPVDFRPPDSPMSLHLIDRESLFSRASRPEPAVPSQSEGTGWSGISRELSERASFFIARLGSSWGAFTGGRKMVRGRKARLLAVFGAVGAVVVVGLLLSLGSGSQKAPGDSIREPKPSTSGDRLAASGAPTEVDPIDYAIAEVTAGRVHLEGMTNSGERAGHETVDGTVDGRVVSRSGDIVLVEVSLTTAETKTFATLLLQEEEGGWQTRDVFEEGL